MKIDQLLLISAAWFALVAAPLHAQVEFSTIDPNATTYTYNSGSINYPVLNHPAGSPPGVYQSEADEFIPTTSFTLSTITFAVRTIANNPGELTAIVYANDPSTNLPLTSAILASATAVAPPGTSSAETVPLTTFDFSAASFTFLTGQIYWIALEPGKEGTDVDWGFTTNNTRGRVAQNLGNGYFQFTEGGNDQTPQFGAFRITAVPEPSSFGLVFLGGSIIAAFLRARGKKA